MEVQQLQQNGYDLRENSALRYYGSFGRTLVINLKNTFLSIITLSLFRFWGKTIIRRYLWSQMVLWGDPFEYTGTGGELFRGFLIAVFFVFFPCSVVYTAILMLLQSGHEEAVFLLFPLIILFSFVIAAGTYLSRRYLLSRTRWRGIRGGLGGSAMKYAGWVLFSGFCHYFTAGWMKPYFDVKLASYTINNTTFGNRKFDCHATTDGMYGPFVFVWLSSLAQIIFAVVIVAIHHDFLDTIFREMRPGVAMDPLDAARLTAIILQILFGAILIAVIPSLLYYRAFMLALVQSTFYMGVRAQLKIGFGSFLALVLGNIFFQVIGFGLLNAWVMVRTLRYMARHLTLLGEPAFHEIGQNATPVGSGTGEGVLSAFDAGGSF